MKTSLGIWALGPMMTRFVPGGYQPQFTNEDMVVKVRRAVDGLGDLMDDYEFHYPGELNPRQPRRGARCARRARDRDGVHRAPHDPRFGRGGLTRPTRRSARRRGGCTRETAELAGAVGAQHDLLARDRGLQLPVPDAVRTGVGVVHRRDGRGRRDLRKHGVKLFLEHKNSEPAMKIFMRNIGMTLHVIHKLRERGITNVQVNMDWQHLIMNGESLGEYAAMLAAEGCSAISTRTRAGARSTTTTWSAPPPSWRRWSWRSSCGVRATGRTAGTSGRSYPYRRMRSRAVERSVLQWRSIDAVAGKIDDDALREAQSAQGCRSRVRDRLRRAQA